MNHLKNDSAAPNALRIDTNLAHDLAQRLHQGATLQQPMQINSPLPTPGTRQFLEALHAASEALSRRSVQLADCAHLLAQSAQAHISNIADVDVSLAGTLGQGDGND